MPTWSSTRNRRDTGRAQRQPGDVHRLHRKLMTALVVLDGNQRLNETLTVTMDDVDRLKGHGSRLAVGSRLSRADMLHIALMSL